MISYDAWRPVVRENSATGSGAISSGCAVDLIRALLCERCNARLCIACRSLRSRNRLAARLGSLAPSAKTCGDFSMRDAWRAVATLAPTTWASATPSELEYRRPTVARPWAHDSSSSATSSAAASALILPRKLETFRDLRARGSSRPASSTFAASSSNVALMLSSASIVSSSS
eukprot:Amastigsp_a349240_24.p2 type:complete len:173 gc:universal Amastigsp_a349240_24:740-222(-)